MNSKQLKEQWKERNWNKRLADIYFDDQEQLAYQHRRYLQAIEKYEQTFGEGDVEIYSAPGRTEIGGNHTDHQNGMVLAAAIHLDAIAVAGKNQDNKVIILSEGYELITVDLGDLELRETEKGTTEALIKGVIAGMEKKGYRVGPFQAYVTSDVLNGAGLSSSAAFETLIGTILSGLYNNMSVSSIEIAMIGQYAENVYFGKPCGLMDQMACSVGSLVHIDFLDSKKPVVNQIEYDIQSKGYSLCVVDTKGSHADLTPDYAAIPAEMKSVAGYFGNKVLTQVSEEEFYEHLPQIRSELGDRAVLRAIHFYKENKRVLLEVKALKEDAFSTFLTVFQESANSSFKYLQNIYSNHDLTNQAVSIALALSESILGDKGVCRVHGGGFAGTIQAFVKTDFVSEYKREIEKYMGKDTCHILHIRKYGGIKVL